MDNEDNAVLADQDESVRIAVRALGDMKNSTVPRSPMPSFQPTPALSATSALSSPSLPSPSLFNEVPEAANSSDFVSRMSRIPVVNTALRAYESSKASSRVVKYGAEMMESSVKSISRPVIDRLPVGQLDEFACRQLDKFGNYSYRSPQNNDTDYSDNWHSLERTLDEGKIRVNSGSPSLGIPHSWSSDTQNKSDHQLLEDASRAQSSHDHRVLTPRLQEHHRTEDRNTTESRSDGGSESPHQVAQRSRWQAMLLEAGGIGAAWSEENMRRLKYCLQWLQYATAHIDAQILVLRNFITSLQRDTLSSQSASHAIASHHLRTLAAAKRDVVDTVKQVVEVVSRHAGGALPEPARARVRSFILCLPKKWAQSAGTDIPSGQDTRMASTTSHGTSSGIERRSDVRQYKGRASANIAPYSYGPGEPGPSPRSIPASRATSPSSSRVHSRSHSSQASGMAGPNRTMLTTVENATQAANRVLTLATESLDMLRGVTAVVKDSLDRADAWVERLRIVGVQRQQAADTNIDPVLLYRDIPSHRSPESSHAHTPSSLASLSPLSPFTQLPPLTSTTESTNQSILSHAQSYARMHVESDSPGTEAPLSELSYLSPLDAQHSRGSNLTPHAEELPAASQSSPDSRDMVID